MQALDYAFELAKALGARAISTEIAEDGPKRVGEFADKHEMMVGYHGHEATGPENWEKVFGYAKHNGANLDIGHFVSGNHGSPIPFLKAHHDRITHIHVKDRKANKGANVPFGEGDTPIAEALRPDPRQQVEHPGHDRVRVPGSRRLGSDDRDQEVHRVLPRRAGVESTGRAFRDCRRASARSRPDCPPRDDPASRRRAFLRGLPLVVHRRTRGCASCRDAAVTTIYFLLQSGEHSALHRVLVRRDLALLRRGSARSRVVGTGHRRRPAAPARARC